MTEINDTPDTAPGDAAQTEDADTNVTPAGGTPLGRKTPTWPLLAGIAALAVAAGVLAGMGITSNSDNGRGAAPQACLDALDHAETGLYLAADALEIQSQGLDAASRLDVDGIEAATDELRGIDDDIRAAGDDYRQASAECRDDPQ